VEELIRATTEGEDVVDFDREQPDN